MRDSRDGAYWVFYAHDERGNVIDRQNNVNAKALALSYDYANQPTAMTGSGDSGAIAGSFTYDGNLKRVKQTVNGKTIYSVYSALGGGISFRDNITDGQEIDFLSLGAATLRLIDGGAPVYTHGDHLGSPVAATDAAGDILWREQYTPFGEKIIDPAANRDLSGYTGHIQDHASGLTYMQARYFDPVIGRFLSTDPIGYNDQMNLYAYVHNDPVNATDPTGMATCTGSNMNNKTSCDTTNGGSSGLNLSYQEKRNRIPSARQSEATLALFEKPETKKKPPRIKVAGIPIAFDAGARAGKNEATNRIITRIENNRDRYVAIGRFAHSDQTAHGASKFDGYYWFPVAEAVSFGTLSNIADAYGIPDGLLPGIDNSSSDYGGINDMYWVSIAFIDKNIIGTQAVQFGPAASWPPGVQPPRRLGNRGTEYRIEDRSVLLIPQTYRTSKFWPE